jgi:hypothetical protein
VYEQLETWETQSHQVATMFAGFFGVEKAVEDFLANRKLINGTNNTSS